MGKENSNDDFKVKQVSDFKEIKNLKGKKLSNADTSNWEGLSNVVDKMFAFPLTALTICKACKWSLEFYAKLRVEYEGHPNLNLLNQLITNSLYTWGMDPKVKSAKVIDLYIDNEIPKSDKGFKLEIINDINEFEKQLQPFDINNKRIDIQNPRDDITVIGDSDDLVEIIETEEADA